MQYTIHGFNQAEAVKLGLNNDDLLILRWFVDFTPSNKIKSCQISDKTFYWLDYSYLLECLPILGKNCKNLSKMNFQHLVDANVLIKEIRFNVKEIKKSGKTAWFSFGKNYELLVNSIFLQSQGSKTTYDQGSKSTYDQGSKTTQDYSNIDSSNKDKCVNTGAGVRACACTHVKEVDLSPILAVQPNLIVNVDYLPAKFNCDVVANAIKRSSKFLQHIKQLKFFVNHYLEVVSDVFIDIGKNTETTAINRRNYTKEQLQEMFPEIDNFDDLDF